MIVTKDNDDTVVCRMTNDEFVAVFRLIGRTNLTTAANAQLTDREIMASGDAFGAATDFAPKDMEPFRKRTVR